MAWQVKDFADGWIDVPDEESARKLSSEQSGAAIRPKPPAEDELLKALGVIANASERSETMFGGKMSDVSRVFQNISRVARAAIERQKETPSE